MHQDYALTRYALPLGLKCKKGLWDKDLRTRDFIQKFLLMDIKIKLLIALKEWNFWAWVSSIG